MEKVESVVELCARVRSFNSKFIFVTGGVCSSIGKGVLISSLGVLLKNAGYSVSVMKCDPYLNVDPGTMSPLIHGEVFVTEDGAETDLDLGHYERLLGINLKKDSSLSSGQIYQEILDGERKGVFLGKCIQMIPHVVDCIKKRLLNFALTHKTDFILVEIGGTVGDIEGEVFLEALRQFKMDLGSDCTMHAHLSLVPFLSWAGEAKTKPTQHSVMELKRAGLVPDCLFLRLEKRLEEHSIEKLSVMCGMKKDYIFQVLTLNPLYSLFFELDRQGVCQKLQEYFGISKIKAACLTEWHNYVGNIAKSNRVIVIGLIVKYIGDNDPYISVVEAIKAAAYAFFYQVRVVFISAESLANTGLSDEKDACYKSLYGCDGVVVPGGFDVRGIEGKFFAARWARECDIPYLGLCLGMQVMVIEAARSLLGFFDANSTEFEPGTSHPVICMMTEQRDVVDKGATMRLGSYPCSVVEGTKAYDAYRKTYILERHRHRYEVNNVYKNQLESVGLVFSGICQEMNLVEIVEHKTNSFMIGTQFHPEFQSSPLIPHPIFKKFIAAVIDKQLKNG